MWTCDKITSLHGKRNRVNSKAQQPAWIARRQQSAVARPTRACGDDTHSQRAARLYDQGMLTWCGLRWLPDDWPEPLAKPPDCSLFATAEPLGLLWSARRRDGTADTGGSPAGWRAVVRCCRCRVRALLAASVRAPIQHQVDLPVLMARTCKDT